MKLLLQLKILRSHPNMPCTQSHKRMFNTQMNKIKDWFLTQRTKNKRKWREGKNKIKKPEKQRALKHQWDTTAHQYKNHQNPKEGHHQILREWGESGTLTHCCCLCQIYLNICVWIGIFRKLQVANLSLGVCNLTTVAEKMLTTSGNYAPPSCPRICIINERRLVPKLWRSKVLIIKRLTLTSEVVQHV